MALSCESSQGASGRRDLLKNDRLRFPRNCATGASTCSTLAAIGNLMDFVALRLPYYGKVLHHIAAIGYDKARVKENQAVSEETAMIRAPLLSLTVLILLSSESRSHASVTVSWSVDTPGLPGFKTATLFATGTHAPALFDFAGDGSNDAATGKGFLVRCTSSLVTRSHRYSILRGPYFLQTILVMIHVFFQAA